MGPFKLHSRFARVTLESYHVEQDGWYMHHGSFEGRPSAIGIFGPLGKQPVACERLGPKCGKVHFYFFPFLRANEQPWIMPVPHELLQYMVIYCENSQVFEVFPDLAITMLCEKPLFCSVLYPLKETENFSIFECGYSQSYDPTTQTVNYIPCIGYHCHCSTPYGLQCQSMATHVTEGLKKMVSEECHGCVDIFYSYRNLRSNILSVRGDRYYVLEC